MSKQNKANKSNYIQAGRMTADDMAREVEKMRGGAKIRDGKMSNATERGGRAPSPPRTGREGSK